MKHFGYFSIFTHLHFPDLFFFFNFCHTVTWINQWLTLNEIQAYKSGNAPREMISVHTTWLSQFSIRFLNSIPEHDEIFKNIAHAKMRGRRVHSRSEEYLKQDFIFSPLSKTAYNFTFLFNGVKTHWRPKKYLRPTYIVLWSVFVRKILIQAKVHCL